MIFDVELLDQRSDGRVKCTTQEDTSIAIYKIPKSMIDVCDENDYKTIGIYFLFDSEKRRVYVGKSTNDKGLVYRAKQNDEAHKDVKKWDWAILIVDISNGIKKIFDSDSVSYLENRFYGLLKSASKNPKYHVTNKGTPQSGNIKNVDRLNKIIEVASKIIYILGFDFLVQDTPFDENKIDEIHIFKLHKKGLEAKLAYDKNSHRFWLLKDSDISKTEVKSCYPWISTSRNAIKKNIKNGKLTQNVPYDNPSRAAGVVVGASISGNEWKNCNNESPFVVINSK